MVPVQPQVDSVYYVHASDGSNSVTITPKLDGTKYAGWRRSMRRALSEKSNISMVDHPIHVPEDYDLNRLAWLQCNHLVHSWIINSVSDFIA